MKGTGGGHGAQGGSVSGDDGGAVYDLVQSPNQQGSGGAGINGGAGAGGGYFKVKIWGTLTCEGKKLSV